MLRILFIVINVCIFAVIPASAQKPGNSSPAQQALDNRFRRFEGLPGQGANAGVPGVGFSGSSGAQISNSRIPESVRERRNEIFSRRFELRSNAHQQLQKRKERPSPGEIPQHAGQRRRAAIDGGEHPTGVRQSQFVSHGRNRRAYTHAERLLAKRLEQIDRLREHYLTTGDSHFLDQADKLEKLAREQYEFRGGVGQAPSQESEPLQPASASPEAEPTHPTLPEMP